MNVHNLVNYCEEAEMNPTTCLQPYLAVRLFAALMSIMGLNHDDYIDSNIISVFVFHC